MELLGFLQRWLYASKDGSESRTAAVRMPGLPSRQPMIFGKLAKPDPQRSSTLPLPSDDGLDQGMRRNDAFCLVMGEGDLSNAKMIPSVNEQVKSTYLPKLSPVSWPSSYPGAADRLTFLFSCTSIASRNNAWVGSQ